MTTSSPKISIILPTYNGASKYLRQSIESCLNQTYQNIELVIVDDCSKDNTAEVIQSFTDPRIKYIRNKTNQRLPRSLNIGFAAATGEFMTWTSDDNEFLPNAIEEMYVYLKNNPGIGFVYADMIVRYFETGAEETRKFSDLNLEKENNVGACYLYTREVYKTVGNYDPRFEWVEDYDYWIRIAKRFHVRHYAKPLYIYGDHVQSLTSTRRYPIVMMRDILRYWHGYLSVGEFLETIRQFSVDVRTHIEGKDKQFEAFKQVIDKVFGISFVFGFYYLVLVGLLSLRMILNVLIKPVLIPARKHAADKAFNKAMASLKKASTGRVNVLCIIPEMVVGGSEKVIWDVVNGLSSHGYDFHLICDKKENNEWCRKFMASFNNVVLLKQFSEDSLYERYISELIRRLNVKIILNTNSRVGYRCLPKLKTDFPGLRVIDILHLEDVGGAIEKYAWAAQYVDQRVCISHHLKEYMKEVYRRNGISADYVSKIEIVHNGTPQADFRNATESGEIFRREHRVSGDDVVISFIGRVALEKKPFLFIDIARTLVIKAPQISWKFVMAGSGPYMSKVRTRISEYQLEDRFVLTGMIADVTPLLANTFLLCVVSRHEGIPLVIQEALNLNVPVLSTNVGAIRELICDDLNGYVIALDEKTSDIFAEKAIRLASDKEAYGKLSAATKATLDPRFLMRTMIERYKEIFDKQVNV